MSRLLFFSTLSLLVASCSDGAERVEKRFPGGQLRSVAYIRNGQFHGPRFMYWPSGQAHLEVHYAEGRQHGPQVTYYPDGKRKTVLHFRDGKLDGAYQFFRPDGRLEVEGMHRAGQEIGPVRRFSPKGQLVLVTTYEAGQNAGTQRQYYRTTGQVMLNGPHRKGNREGWTVFRRDSLSSGGDSVRVLFANGKPVRAE